MSIRLNVAIDYALIIDSNMMISFSCKILQQLRHGFNGQINEAIIATIWYEG